MNAHDDILADRLNAEPAIFKGCSSSELGVIVGVAALVWLPLSLLIAGLMGVLPMGFGLAGVGVVATVVITASLFQRLKRNRPDGYYQQRFAISLHERGLRRAPFVRRSGAWDIGRTLYAPLPSRDR
jgi:conjugative transfer region protein (TIGR03750 family)